MKIAEDEAPIIRLIYDKFVNTTMGIGAIAVFLNQNGYRKKRKDGNSLDTKVLEKEHSNLKEQLKQLQGAKNKLASLMELLSVSDKYYDKKYQDMQERMDGCTMKWTHWNYP